MARSFTKNASNYLTLPIGTLGTLLNGASKVSVHLWLNATTLDSGSTNNVCLSSYLNGASNGLFLCIDGSTATKKLLLGGRSKSTDSFQSRESTSGITTGTWYALGGVLNFSAGSITPYFNGAAQNSGAATFGGTAYTQGSPTPEDSVGCAISSSHVPTSTADQVNGSLAEVAIWSDDIGANAFAALARGQNAWAIRPTALVLYMPLWGLLSPEPDLSGHQKSGTITGSVPQANHAPVTLFTRKRPKVTRSAPLQAAVASCSRWFTCHRFPQPSLIERNSLWQACSYTVPQAKSP